MLGARRPIPAVCGPTAGLIDRVLPAREIVETMLREAAARIAAVSRATAGVPSAA
jgi:hypothetical protein